MTLATKRSNMNQYTEIDRRIIDCIRSGQGAHPLYDKRVSQEAYRLAKLTGREDFRIVDGRLQVLKKRGEISYSTTTRAWVIKEAA